MPMVGMPVVTPTSSTATVAAAGASSVMWRAFPHRHDEATTMKSLQHVLWRGALALTLMAVGIGSGVGMAPAEQAAIPANCPAQPRVLVAEQSPPAIRLETAATVIVLRGALTRAG